MSIEVLQYWSQDRVIPLPAWACWFIDAGVWLARETTENGRVVLAIATPTRAFAAALLAFGLIRERAIISSSGDHHVHLLQLRNLPKGSPMAYRDTRKRINGEYVGIEFKNGVEMIGLKVGGKGNDTWWYPIEHAIRFEPIENNGSSTGKRLRARKIPASTFLRSCCATHPSCIEILITSSRQECIILGQQSLLHKEITETSFMCSDVTGTLQDLIRVKDYLNPGEAYRCAIHPMGKSPQVEQDSMPHIVIFDGARGYLRWRDEWPATHQVVVLDYIDAEFPDAVQTLNGCYPYRVVAADLSHLPHPPAELSVMVYREVTP